MHTITKQKTLPSEIWANKVTYHKEFILDHFIEQKVSVDIALNVLVDTLCEMQAANQQYSLEQTIENINKQYIKINNFK